MMSTPHLLLGGLVGAITIFALAYVVGARLKNFGIVDVVWSYAVGLLGLTFAWVADGSPVRRGIIGAMVGLWSLRLGTHLLRRVASQHPKEDPRYAEFREKWKGNLGLKMFGAYQLQALLVVILNVPVAIAARNSRSALTPLEMVAVGLWFVAVMGEGLADRQLAQFKARQSEKPAVCAVGLWRYSRHPNYFFEWLMWVAVALFALSSPNGWIGLIAPIAMFYFVVFATGIPMTEQQSLRSKGESYRRYQAVTSAFVPWPPKKRLDK